MQVKLGKIVVSVDALKALFNSKIKSITKAYDLSRCIDIINPEIESYEQVRVAKIKELGKPVEDGSNEFKLSEEGVEEYKKCMQELSDKLIDLPELSINLSDIAEADLTPMQVSTLKWLISDDRS